MKENWMEDLRDRLAEFEIDAPAGLWEELQKPRHVWRRRLTAAAAAVLLLLVGGGIYFLIPGTPDMTTAEHTAAVIDAPAPSPSPLDPAPPTPGKQEADNPREAEEAHDLDDSLPANSGQPEKSVVAAAAEAAVADSLSSRSNPVSGGKVYFTPAKQTGQDKVSIGFIASCKSDGTGQSYQSHIPPIDDGLENPGEPDRETPMRLSHSQPIRFGITAEYRLNDRLSIETGVTYTKLRSEGHEKLLFSTVDFYRDLHYIGIPLNLKWRAWSWKFCDLYLSAGAMGEKCVCNHTVMTSSYPWWEGTLSPELTVKPFQWTVSLSGGVQLRPWRHIALFAEPGLEYRFSDGSDLSTFYSEHPFGFNLKIGVRFILSR